MPHIKKFIISLALFQVLLIAVHLAVYRTAEAAFGRPPAGWGAAIGWVFVVLAFTFLMASVLARRWHGRAMSAFYTFAAYWFGLINFLFVGACAFFVVASLLYPSNLYVSPALLGGIAFGAMFLLHLYATWNSGRVEVVRVAVEGIPGLPEAWRGRKIAFISDVHLGALRGARFSARIARTVRREAPYALFIGGDLYDGPACDEAGVVAPLAALAKELPGGIWYVTGNHEYFTPDPERTIRTVGAAGMRVLRNEAGDLDGVRIAGMDEKDTHTPEEFRRALEQALKGSAPAPTILMSHVPVPANLDLTAAKGVALELSGHTHHGQIFPFQFVVKKTFKGYGYGMNVHPGGMKVYTSSGVGTWGPPMRLGTHSEVVILEFR